MDDYNDWIVIRVDLSKTPEVLQVAALTGKPVFEVVGLLAWFWVWFTTDNDSPWMPGVILDDLPEVVGGDRQFWEAVQEVGWLLKHPNGGVIGVPNFDRWLSQKAKRRLLAEREADLG